MSQEFPKYKCHKEVRAVKLARVEHHQNPTSIFLVPEDKRFDKIEVDYNFIAKHNPAAGGYYIVYQDGYTSWSPAEAFEDGYTLIEE